MCYVSTRWGEKFVDADECDWEKFYLRCPGCGRFMKASDVETVRETVPEQVMEWDEVDEIWDDGFTRSQIVTIPMKDVVPARERIAMRFHCKKCGGVDEEI